MNNGDPVNDRGDIGPKNINGNLLLLLGSINDLYNWMADGLLTISLIFLNSLPAVKP